MGRESRQEFWAAGRGPGSVGMMKVAEKLCVVVHFLLSNLG